MNDHEFTPEEQNTIRRIQAGRVPKLDDAARARMRTPMLDEFRAVDWSAQPPNAASQAGLTLSLKVILIAAGVVIALVVIALVISRINQIVPEVTPEQQVITTPVMTGTLTPAGTASWTAAPPAVIPSTTATMTAPVTVPPASSDTPVIPATTPVSNTVSTTAAPDTSVIIPSSPAATVPATTTPDITVTPEMTATAETVVIIEGPVTSIVNNIITIYDFAIMVEPQHPILQVIQVGDVIRIEGVPGANGGISAHIISNIPGSQTTNGSVSLDGPVESINGSKIVVNGITVQLAPDDPRLSTLTVGSFVSVQGNFQGSGSNIVLVVVNVTVINNVTVEQNSQCWYHDDAMGMGHWHCDGMGMGEPAMGDPAMGMGEPAGMGDPGMGDPAMGMGG